MVDLGGYVIILVETKDKKIKLYGSPADKADLEVGDEILEVNGKSLEDASHTEVIAHIHQCIRSRTICLRVKRRTGNKLAADLAASSNVQDAFVIAVEQRAKERLERLSALKKIKPVDISKLSSQLSEPGNKGSCNNSTTQSPSTSTRTAHSEGAGAGGTSENELNGGTVFDTSSIYVTSVPNLTSANSCEQLKTKSGGTRSRSTTPNPQTSASPSPRHKQQQKSPSKTPSPHKEVQVHSSASKHSSSTRDTSNNSHSREGSHRQHRRSSSKRSSTHSRSNPSSQQQKPLVAVATDSSSQLYDADPGNKSGDELELTHDLDNSEEEGATTPQPPRNRRSGVEEELEDSDREEEDPLNPLNTTGDSRSEDDLDEDISESGDSLPATPEKTYGIGSTGDRREVLLDSKRPKSPLEIHTSGDSISSRKSGGSGNSGGSSSKAYNNKSRQQEYRDSEPDADTMISMVEFDPSNKEMAVDVPETFVGRTKTPPRYPPPKVRQSPIHHNNNNNSNSSKGSKKEGSSGGSVTPVNGTLPKPVSPPPKIPQQPQHKAPENILVQSPGTQDEIKRIKRYEEEIKTRREREEALAELQRTSIRGSQKLQSLASYPAGSSPSRAQPTGTVNPGFEESELDLDDDDDDDDSGSSPSIKELIESLQRIQSVLKSNGHKISEDMTLVAQLLVNPEFQKVLAVHNKVQETWCLNRPPTPHFPKSQQLATECIELLQKISSPEAMELVELLNKYTLEGLFYSHDRIADSEPLLLSSDADTSNSSTETGTTGIIQDTLNESTEVSVDRPTITAVMAPSTYSNYPEKNIKIVRIDKTNDPLGATIRNEGDAVIIGRIVRGGAAERSGLLHEGDEILEVNEREVRGKSVNDVCDMLAGMTGTLTFIIIPTSVAPPPPAQPTPTAPTHVKAYFDYDPEEDMYIPCRELGMSFMKGDILHVINQADPNWWQAYRDGEDDQSLAGLIPSKSFQEQREAVRQTVVGSDNIGGKEKTKKGKLLCAKKHHKKKKKKKMLYPNYTEDLDADEILTYEPVDLYFPTNNRKRPIVLIGPPNIGRHELRQKLMEIRDRFAAAVPHTSRPKRDRELDGQDYHFISRTQFEADILARKFVEHGEYEKAYYGTSLNAIRGVVNSGKICVLNLHPLSLKMLKNSDLKPYVVLIAPPSLEKLRQKKMKMSEPFKEEDLKEIIEKAREMEDQYGHYFDLVLINQDIERTYQQLIQEINILEREPQWVPAAWLQNSR